MWAKLLTLCFLIANVLNICDSKLATQNGHGKVIVCYISTWAIYRPGNGAYSIEDFDPTLCTHAIYAFAGLDLQQSAIYSLDPWQDLKDNYGKGGYERLTAMKQTNPHLKVTLAIGGWSQGSSNYSILAADPVKRSFFAKQVSIFLRKYNFDGLDLDWEYPTKRGGAPHDRENFVLLVKALRNEFKPHDMILTAAIGANLDTINSAYDIKSLSKYLDFYHIMCYDYHGLWDKQIGYNAPLTTKSKDGFNVMATVELLEELGAPLNKLVLGLPFYGRSYTTSYNGEIGDFIKDTAMQGPYTRTDGFLGYNEICEILDNKTELWIESYDTITQQMLARSRRHPINGTINVLAYDNPRSIAQKVLYVVKKRLAGLMVWSVDTDDFRGLCSEYTDTYVDYKHFEVIANTKFPNYPLLRTISEAIKVAYEHQDSDFKYNDAGIFNNLDEESERADSLGTKIDYSLVTLFTMLALISVY